MLVRTVVAAYLRECGFDVIEANGADEAIRVLQAEVRVDIVFSDINMPGSMDGFGLAQWVRRERPWLKVILTSGAARTAKEAGDLCEHGPILAKPYDHAELERQLRACWRKTHHAEEARGAISIARANARAVVGHRPRHYPPLRDAALRAAPQGEAARFRDDLR